ncbi:MAG: hypothetical protein ACK5A3_10330, partial [Planctomyces sp.]
MSGCTSASRNAVVTVQGGNSTFVAANFSSEATSSGSGLFPSPQSPSGGAAGFSVAGIAAKPQATKPQS